MVWSYGLVAEDNKVLLCEIYYDLKNKAIGYCHVGVKEINTPKLLAMVVNDISSQIEFDKKIYGVKEFKKVGGVKNGKDRGRRVNR